MDSSPLSLFEAVFKVIEERLPFGRQLVTITSVLMVVVLIVFCVGYLIDALAATLSWGILSLKTGSLAPLLMFSVKHNAAEWWLTLGLLVVSFSIAAWAWNITKSNLQTMKTVDDKMKELQKMEEELNLIKKP